MDLFEAIYRRRSIRRFDPNYEVSDEELEKILHAGVWAPSDENMQNYRFIVVRDKETIEYLAEANEEITNTAWGLSGSIDMLQARVWYLPEKSQLRTIKGLMTGSLMVDAIRTCSLIIIPCYTIHGWIEYPRPTVITRDLSLVSVALALQNMWLTAYALGLGAAFIGAPIYPDPRRRALLAEKLGIPRLWEPLCCFLVGKPTRGRPAGPPRHSLECHIFSERWGRPYIRKAIREVEKE